MKRRFGILLTVLFAVCAGADVFIMADPDFPATGFDITSAPAVKIGEHIGGRYFDAGGFFMARNEPRFNQKLLPNHNWRGFGYAVGRFPVRPDSSRAITLSAGFEHESAHPTMGIEKQINSAYEAIYDGSYRRYALNSFVFTVAPQVRMHQFTLRARLDYQLYFASKNTPKSATRTCHTRTAYQEAFSIPGTFIKS